MAFEMTSSQSAAQPAAAPPSPVVSRETECVAGIGAGTRAVPGKSGISIADRAHERLRKLLEERATPEAGLRVAVKGGGCSGLSYALTWEDKPREKDRVFAREGVRVFVDPKSYIYLVGTVVEYEEKLLQAGFKLTNPQVRTTCGCGESFTI
jgi:iron-sulfur cluster assembly protein